ncbi:hypothetical protein GCM10009574_098630 [Streptomyces asiaticus]|uniref:Uncharacterized protein n=2 Tax=Streptomyces rhizosphaericus TaxID=114699 RepID=A0ABN1NUU1_9ACTN
MLTRRKPLARLAGQTRGALCPAYDPAVDIPDRLIELQTAADAEHAKDTGLSRADLEAAVKRAVRHPDDG